MNWLKVLEEDNIHLIVGLGEKGRDTSIASYATMSRLSAEKHKRRFTIHVVTMKPSPLYMEDLRELLQSNIAYTITVRYHDFDFQKISRLLEELKKEEKIIYGVVSSDLAELAKLLEEKGIPVEKV